MELIPTCCDTPLARIMSPSGPSILITSAPRSASTWVAKGPRTTEVRSSTRMPSSGPLLGARWRCPSGIVGGVVIWALEYSCLLSTPMEHGQAARRHRGHALAEILGAELLALDRHLRLMASATCSASPSRRLRRVEATASG